MDKESLSFGRQPMKSVFRLRNPASKNAAGTCRQARRRKDRNTAEPVHTGFDGRLILNKPRRSRPPFIITTV